MGKLADIAVLDWDYFPVPTEEINDIQVNLTIVGEDVVWERALADQEPRTVR